MKRFLVTFSTKSACEVAASSAAVQPESVADVFLELGATSVDMGWYGSWETLSTALAEGDLRIGATTPHPAFETAKRLLITSEDTNDLASVAKDIFWRSVTLDVFWPGDDAAKAAEEVGRRVFGREDALTLTELSSDDADWTTSVRDQCPPVRLGNLVVAHTLNDAAAIEKVRRTTGEQAPLLTLEVGSGFGFGDHPTTRVMSGWLLSGRCNLSGASVLDYGCGTGVLGLGALLLGAEAAVGVDCDFASLLLARANAARNGLPLTLYSSGDAHPSDWQCVSFYSPSSNTRGESAFPIGPPMDQRFHVVVANIIRGPLHRLAPRLVGSLAPGGTIALSGFQEPDAASVVAAYRAQGVVDFQQEVGDEGWVLLVGKAPV